MNNVYAMHEDTAPAEKPLCEMLDVNTEMIEEACVAARDIARILGTGLNNEVETITPTSFYNAVFYQNDKINELRGLLTETRALLTGGK